MLAGLWLRPTMGCPSCHHRFPIHESPLVTVEACDVAGAPATELKPQQAGIREA
jgi:hypothetical protein